MRRKNEGFTLVELIIVLAVIVAVTVVIVLLINPPELLRQARDRNRYADMGSLALAITSAASNGLSLGATSTWIYCADEGGTCSFSGTKQVRYGTNNTYYSGIFTGGVACNNGVFGDPIPGFYKHCDYRNIVPVYVSLPDPAATSAAGSDCSSLGLPTLPLGGVYHCAASSTYRRTDGTGWIPINFSDPSLGNAFRVLPIDPANQSSTRLYYTYVNDNAGGYEVTASMESQKYKLGGSSDKTSTDGGGQVSLYESGSDVQLEPLDYGDSSLVGYWTLNEGMGTIAYDYSGGNATGSWNGTTAGTSGYYSGGMTGGSWAGQFNGTNDYISVSSGSGAGVVGTSDFSVSLWVKDGTIISDWYETYISPGNGDDNPKWETNWAVIKLGTLQGSTAGEIEFDIGKGSGNSYFSLSTSNPVNDGLWHQIVAVANRHGNAYIYIDGVQRGSSDISSAVVNLTAPQGLAIGHNNTGGFFTDAQIDDVRVYNRALSGAEIAAIYNAKE